MGWSSPGSSVRGISQAGILNGLPFSSLGDLSVQEIEPTFSALAGEFFPAESPGKPLGRLELFIYQLFGRKKKLLNYCITVCIIAQKLQQKVFLTSYKC